MSVFMSVLRVFSNGLSVIAYRVVLLVCGVVIIGAVTACNDSTSPNNDTYTLVGVNGEALPYEVPDTEDDVTVLRGSLRLRENGTFTFRLTTRLQEIGESVPTETTATVNGRYTEEDNAFVFLITEPTEDTATGTREGNEITIPDALPGIVLVFRR